MGLNMQKKIRVLQIGHGIETFGGVESFLLQYYSHINQDRIKFDFLFCCSNTMEKCQNDPLLANSKIVAMHDIKTNGNSLKNYYKLVMDINAFLKESEYDIIHINTANQVLQTFLAIFMKTNSVRIAHSHSVRAIMASPNFKSSVKIYIKRIAEPIFQHFIRQRNDYLFACSIKAGITLFGTKGVRCGKFKLIKNAICADKYRFNKDIRENIRNQYGINKACIVYGTVGRLVESKNLLFLLDIFQCLHDKNENSVLWIIGQGSMRQEIEQKVKIMGLTEVVYLMGERKNIPDFLQAMDCFIFPTVYEGLGIVAIEAQAAGLPIVASDVVPKETRITDLISYVDLKSDAQKWSESIEQWRKHCHRCNTTHQIIDAGYDIESAAKELQDFYEEILKVR